MSDLSAMIDIFRAQDVPVETRISIIKNLSFAIDYNAERNIAEPIANDLIAELNRVQRVREEAEKNPLPW